MPPNRKTPGPPDPEEALKHDKLTLEKLGRIVAVTSEPKGRKRGATDPVEKISPQRLRRQAFFHSPVDKSAWTIKGHPSKAKKSLVFDADGVLCGDDPSPEALERSAKALLAWLRLQTSDANKKTLVDWVTEGRPNEGPIFEEIEKQLKKTAVSPELLYNQPVCRLVRQDQLRYDPNYQALYQITPAQEQLTRMQSKEFRKNYDRIKRNQRVYWGISETFQSLVALFDSDLGRGKDAIENKKADLTKEFIRIAVQEKAKQSWKALSPAGLNRYSPLRFWAPPPSFASSVFHMLFWRSIITRKDLFGREVKGESVQERAGFYYVCVNYFNPAKFRIADYPTLFRAILTIARELEKQADKQGNLKSPKENLPLPETGPAQLFYPRYLADLRPKFQEFEKMRLLIPFSEYQRETWDLAEKYKSPELLSGLLRFLRDRAIELILWSTYQMEIRSIGLIPIQYLYKINLKKGVSQFFEKMTALHRASPENFPDITELVSKKLLEPNFNSQIKLERVYGGPHRDVLQPELFEKDSEKIKWLEK